MSPSATADAHEGLGRVPYIPLDPKHPSTLTNPNIKLPERAYGLNQRPELHLDLYSFEEGIPSRRI